MIKTARIQTEITKEEWKSIIYASIEEIEIATKSFLMSKEEFNLANKISQETESILNTTKERLQAGLVSEFELLEDERQCLRANIKKVE